MAETHGSRTKSSSQSDGAGRKCRHVCCLLQCGFVNAFVPSSDRSDYDLLVSLSRGLSVRHDAVWKLVIYG